MCYGLCFFRIKVSIFQIDKSPSTDYGDGMDIDSLANEATATLSISADASGRFQALMPVLLENLNRSMISHPQMAILTGGNPRSVMLDNHSNHIDFMVVVLKFKAFGMLCRTVPWVYRSYRAHGFSFDYFSVELENWKKVIQEHMEPTFASEVLSIYDWMIQHHADWIELSSDVSAMPDAFPEFKADRQTFCTHLLAADYPGCKKIAETFLEKENGQEMLYMGLIQPSMYEIGRMWEQDEVSTAEEHLATSMVARILASTYGRLSIPSPDKGKAVVSCAPNEFHELGGRILADMLELDGWGVIFLGANTPSDKLIELLKKNKPYFLALSLTMPFGLELIAKCIADIKGDEHLKDLKIMVGGLAFSQDPTLWKVLGADAWGSDPETAIQIARNWQNS